MIYLKIVAFLATATFTYGNCGKCDAEHPGQPHDHDEIVGTIVGINEETQTIELMTPDGPKSLKINEHSDLLVPGEFEGAVFDMDIEKFKRESRGKEVRIASRNGVIDHIEPADYEGGEHSEPGQPGPHGDPAAPHHQGQPGPHGGPVPPHHSGQPGPHGDPAAPHHPNQPGPHGDPVPPHHSGQPGPHGDPAAPHHPGQPGPGAHNQGEEDGDAIVGKIIGIDQENNMIEILTEQGPVKLKVNEHSDLLVPGEYEGPLFDSDIEEFKREASQHEVRIEFRNGVIDHIEPADYDEAEHGDHQGGPPHGGPVPHTGPQGGPPPHTGPQGGPQGGPPPPFPGQQGPR